MAGRTANIKVKLSSGAFTAELKKNEAKVKASGKRMGKSMGRELNSGFMRGQKALTNMGKSMGRMIRQAGTIGAAFATGALLKDSVEIHKSFQDISFLVSKLPGQAMQWQEVQDLVTGAAERTTRTTREMADAFKQVYVATGDLDYAKESLDMIGKAATASGAPIEQIAQVSEMVRRKWGVTGKAADEMLTAFIAKADKGGLSLDQLSSRLDAVAGEAAVMGTDASELLGIISQLDSVMGAMAPRGMKTLLQYLKEGATQTMRLEKAGQFKFDPNMDALDRIRTIIKSPAAHEEALTVFTETSRTAFDELAKPFTKTLEAAREAGDTEEMAQAKALAAYDQMVVQIRKTEMSAADIDRMYEKRVSDDPSVKMRQALNKIRDAFAQPKMIEAITKLADKLPALAIAVADLVSFIVDNPLGAAGVGMGLRVGVPMMMGGFMRGGGGGGLPAGGGAGGAAATSGFFSAGAASKKASFSIKKLGTTAGNAIGQFAGAAAMGYALGKAAESMIEAEGRAFDVMENVLGKASDLYAGAIGAKVTTEEKVKALEGLKAKREKVKKEVTGKDIGLVEAARRNLEMIFGDREMSFRGFAENKEATAAIAEIRRKEEKLRDEANDQLVRRLEKETAAAKSAEEIAVALDKAAKSFGTLYGVGGNKEGGTKGGSGTRGTSGKLTTDPGAEPKGG